MYNPVEFWGKRGTGIDKGLDHPIHKIHFDNILDMLKDTDIQSVLEIGSGYGRTTRMLLERMKSITHYDALEISPSRVKAAHEFIPSYNYHDRLTIIEDNFENFQGTQMYDLVISVECLMHQLPSEITNWMRKMFSFSKRFVMNLDWYEPNFKGKIAEWNFSHEYERIYESLGFYSLEKRQISSQQWLYLAEVDQLSEVPPFRQSYL
jgi:SAM-dependent methyltransferase